MVKHSLNSDSNCSITIWGINYAPEKTGIGPQNVWFAEELVKRGYQVRMVCAFTYYPTWLKNPEDKGKLYRSEMIKGVDIQRNWLFVPRSPSLLSRTLQQISFVLFSSLRILFSRPSDHYIVVSPPFLLSPVMRVLSFLKSRSYFVHVQDDEVSAAFETTNLGVCNYRLFKALEVWGHRGASSLSTISDGMKQRLHEQRWGSDMNPRPQKTSSVVLLSNRVEGMGEADITKIDIFRSKLGTKRLLVYSGNLGDKQVLDDLITEVLSFKKENLMFYICGQGAQRENLESFIAQQGKSAENIVLNSLLPDEEYRILLGAADACVLSEMTQKGQWLSPGICFASKMLSYMKQRKPLFVYAGSESEAVRIVETQECGFTLKPGQPLHELLQAFIETDDEVLLKMGEHGKTYYQKYSSDYDLNHWIDSMGFSNRT